MNKQYVPILIIVLLILLGLAGGLYYYLYIKKKSNSSINNSVPTTQTTNNNTSNPATETVPPVSTSIITSPISNAKSRITKKPFGIYITPATSPIQPEKFSGYHTGVDFETTPAEAKIDVPIYAVCNGQILVKKWVSGYGGVIVESCTIEGQAVTVLYGHVDITGSFVSGVGSSITAGQHLVNLAPGYSYYTDGERKHLHLGIHKGSAIEYRGYVQSAGELSAWMDAGTLL
jgi:hypothetical protein